MKITKTGLLLFGIFLLAFILRVIVALQADIGPDEMVYSVLPLNIISARALGTIEQSPVYFYLVDLGYQLFGGMTAFTTRLPSILFGSLATMLIFLVCSELFNDKNMALLAAFLFAVSGFALRNNFEMDMTAYFLVLLSTIFFFRFLGNQKIRNLYLAAAFLAVAVLVKNIVIVFIPAYIITFIGYGIHHKLFFINAEGKFSSDPKLWAHIIGTIMICLLIVTPVFIYNYLSYESKGVTDYYFSQMLGIGKTAHVGIQEKNWSIHMLGNVFKEISVIKMPIHLLLGPLGLIILFRKKVYRSLFFLISMVTLVVYMGGKTASPSHYLWLPIVLSIYGAGLVCFVKDKFFPKIAARHFFFIFVAAVLIFNSVRLYGFMTHTSATLQLNNHIHKNVVPGSIIVIDPRIYSGIHAWVFSDQHYVDGSYFPKVIEQLEGIPENQKREIPLYYVECGRGTNCGWKEEDFQRIYNFSEQLSSYFQQRMKLVARIKQVDNFNIYQGKILAPPAIYDSIDKTHLFWFYSVGWKHPEINVDYYAAQGNAAALEGVGLFMLYLDVLVAILSVPLTIYMVVKRRPDHQE